MDSVVADFVEKAAELVPGNSLRGATAEQIEALAAMEQHELPSRWIDLATSCLGSGSSFRPHVVYGTLGLESFSYPLQDRAEVSLIDELLSSDLGLRGRFLGSMPLFGVGAITGPGTGVYLVGRDDDPPVALFDDPARTQTWSLVALRFTSWLQGLLPQDGVERYGSQPPLLQPTVFEVLGSNRPPAQEVLALVDTILDQMMTIPLPARGATEQVDRSWIVTAEHHWLSPRGHTATHQIAPDRLRSRYGALLDAIVGTALIATAGGNVLDGVGVLGEGSNVSLSAGEALEALKELKVDGDFDDLCLQYRQTVARPAYSPPT